MPVRIVLRNRGEVNPFREMLTWLSESPEGDSLVLCSGYITETNGGYSVLGDGLLKSLKKGCSGGELITVSTNFSNNRSDDQWKDNYRNFVKRLRAAQLNVKPYVSSQNNWHAKIAIRLKKRQPISALIGSSNLTYPAFGRPKKGSTSWNFESDVLIWIGSNISVDEHFRQDFSTTMPFGDMALILDPHVEQLDEQGQLNSLYHSIMHSDLTLVDDH